MTLLRLLWTALLLWFSMGAIAAEPVHSTIQTGDIEIPAMRYQAAGKTLVLWFPSEYGTLSAEHIAARHLAEKGQETWLVDLYGARFLPVVPSSAETLPAEDVYQVIRAAQQTRRKIWLLTAGRGAKYVLEGARLWAQKEGRKKPLAGAVLLYPNLYEKQPEPGEDAAYLPIASDTHLRIVILQGELSPWYWTLDTLQRALERKGSRVTVQTLPDTRDRFYFREGASATERAQGERLPELIAAVIANSAKPPRSTK